jgi:hypothetical protein
MAGSEKKPLSEQWIGYLLAVAAGTLGGPIGWLSSPLVLFGLTKVMKEKDGKHPNRFLAWAAIGIVGVPVSAVPLLLIPSDETAQQAPTSVPVTGSAQQPVAVEQAPQPAAPAQEPQQRQGSGVTMANFGRIQTGMSYEDVVKILGEEGTLMSSNEMAGYKTDMYMWKAGGLSIGNMNAMFQNGQLIQKSQFELP